MIRFRADLSPLTLSSDRLLLIGERERIVLLGTIYGDLVDALRDSGNGGDQELAERLAKKHSRQTVRSALDDLRARGLLVDSDSSLSPREAAYWEGIGVPAGEADRKLRQATVALETRIQGADTLLAGWLQGFGLRMATPSDILLVAVEDYLESELETINERALETNRPWLLYRPLGRQLWLGPLFVPGSGPCWECLRVRLLENRWTDMAVWSIGLALPPEATAGLPSTLGSAAGIVATEVARWIVTGESRLRDVLLTLGGDDLTLRTHPLSQLPDCPKCSSKARVPTGDAVGEPALGLREKMMRHYSHLTGFISGFRDLSHDAWTPFRIWTVTYTIPLNADGGLAAYRPELATGRGLRDEEAQLGCLAEAAERRSAYWRGTEKRVKAAWSEIGATAVHPSDLLLFSDRQYRDRVETGGRGQPELHVPQPFQPEIPIDWVEGQNWTGAPRRFLPAAYCFYHHEDPENPYCKADSNGCAAGESLTEAILSGLYELVERDAAACWWYNRVTRPVAPFHSFQDAFPLSGEAVFAKQGRRLHLLDLTTDWGIPVYAAVSFDDTGRRVAVAFGAHHSAQRAVRQAVTELVQTITALELSIQAGDQGIAELRYSSGHIQDYPFLLPSAQSEGMAPTRPAERTPEEWLAHWTEKAVSLGLELLTVDLTRPEIGIPVARVIVPGLRHFWPRLASGRLFTLPVQLGWQRHEKTESELNPEPCLV